MVPGQLVPGDDGVAAHAAPICSTGFIGARRSGKAASSARSGPARTGTTPVSTTRITCAGAEIDDGEQALDRPAMHGGAGAGGLVAGHAQQAAAALLRRLEPADGQRRAEQRIEGGVAALAHGGLPVGIGHGQLGGGLPFLQQHAGLRIGDAARAVDLAASPGRPRPPPWRCRGAARHARGAAAPGRRARRISAARRGPPRRSGWRRPRRRRAQRGDRRLDLRRVQRVERMRGRDAAHRHPGREAQRIKPQRAKPAVIPEPPIAAIPHHSLFAIEPRGISRVRGDGLGTGWGRIRHGSHKVMGGGVVVAAVPFHAGAGAASGGAAGAGAALYPAAGAGGGDGGAGEAAPGRRLYRARRRRLGAGQPGGAGTLPDDAWAGGLDAAQPRDGGDARPGAERVAGRRPGRRAGAGHAGGAWRRSR